MTATKEQKKLIHINTPTRDMKEEFVQWATGDVKKISTNDLTFDQANKILVKLGLKPHKPENWAVFDKNNPKHRMILAQMHTLGWTRDDDRRGTVPDMDILSHWIKSKSPVKKPLQDMDGTEVEKLIAALKGVIKWTFK